jgi:hypothetical protein
VILAEKHEDTVPIGGRGQLAYLGALARPVELRAGDDVALGTVRSVGAVAAQKVGADPGIGTYLHITR